MTQKSMLAFAITLAALVGGVGGWGLAKSTYPPLQVLASTTETVIGQPFTYPAGRAKITAALVTIDPTECRRVAAGPVVEARLHRGIHQLAVDVQP